VYSIFLLLLTTSLFVLDKTSSFPFCLFAVTELEKFDATLTDILALIVANASLFASF
jgi:hypothetical protein